MNERSQARVDRIAGLFEKPMLVAAVLVIPAIVIEESGLASPWPLVAAALNWAIWIAFAVEFVVLLWLVPGRWRWIRDHPLEVAIVVLTPAVSPWPPSGASRREVVAARPCAPTFPGSATL